jgi:hypothetical protein
LVEIQGTTIVECSGIDNSEGFQGEIAIKNIDVDESTLELGFGVQYYYL